MKCDKIIESNKTYWNDYADLWFGTTALPVYGVRFPTEFERDSQEAGVAVTVVTWHPDCYKYGKREVLYC